MKNNNVMITDLKKYKRLVASKKQIENTNLLNNKYIG